VNTYGNLKGLRVAAMACSADVARPFGVLDAADVAGNLDRFHAASPTADIAEPTGVLNFFDVAAYLSAFTAYCP
jgi:hypothetical protein